MKKHVCQASKEREKKKKKNDNHKPFSIKYLTSSSHRKHYRNNISEQRQNINAFLEFCTFI